jgi:hypothetical protein
MLPSLSNTMPMAVFDTSGQIFQEGGRKDDQKCQIPDNF